jgi:hypothetical protein
LETEVTDGGLIHLKGLTNLRLLDLMGTKVSDAGMAHLKALTHLTDLNLMDTKVTDVGVAEIQKALPKCDIFPMPGG